MKKEIMRLDRVTLMEGEVTLLDDLNLHIFEGEIMGLVCLNSQWAGRFGESPLSKCSHTLWIYLLRRAAGQ